MDMPVYEIEGRKPQLPASGRYWIAPDANVIGQVQLGDDVTIWFGCTLRGDRDLIAIGDRSNVQEHSIMHTDPGYPLQVGRNCTIGHGVILHGCTIGDNCLIGMGATILNGAKIGANSLVGANALVTEGKEFPPHSLIVGSPAKVVRELDEKTAAGLSKSADNYVENGRRYIASFKRVE
jgi:carbonic anhydrase/acetyltransferase-like protein (isoleucine patch superfamily)